MGIDGRYGRWVQIQCLDRSVAARWCFRLIFFVIFVEYIVLNTGVYPDGLASFGGVVIKVYRFGSGIVSCISANTGRIEARKMSGMFIWSEINYGCVPGSNFDRNR
jgi:hypothetical protein